MDGPDFISRNHLPRGTIFALTTCRTCRDISTASFATGPTNARRQLASERKQPSLIGLISYCTGASAGATSFSEQERSFIIFSTSTMLRRPARNDRGL